MSGPTGGTHSATGEAVEQLAGAVKTWTDVLSSFAIAEADRMRTGPYGLGDLVTVPVRWGSAVVSATARTLETAPDNTALFTRRGPGGLSFDGPRLRTDVVAVTPPAEPVEARVTELRGLAGGFAVPAERITLDPAVVQPGTLEVTLTIDASGLPNDIYSGEVRAPDGTPLGVVRLAMDDLGDD